MSAAESASSSLPPGSAGAADATVLARVWGLVITFSQVPSYHLVLEASLVCWVLWLLIHRASYRNRGNKSEKLTKEEEEELLAEWTPEPLVPEVDPDHPALHVPIIDEKPSKHISVEGHKCLNLATHNYLGFAGNEEVERSAVECIRKFGVGSCGPRAFYGTADVHIHLEEKLASYFGTEQAILYSYGFSTVASAIPAYAKKGDIIFADECVNFAVQKGLDASRSKIKFFRHNDAEHLQSLLEQQAQEDKKHPKLAKVSRRFLIVEGVYINQGTLCKIEKMIDLKRKYKLRLFIDESVSFGTIGEHGRGITELKNISMDDIDLIMGSLETSVGSIGGFCAGTTYVVEHQTLAGLGYCFSASLPPMLAAGALTAVNLMEKDPTMFTDLQEKCAVAQECFGSLPGLSLHGDAVSVVKHLRVRNEDGIGSNTTREDEKDLLNQVVLKSRSLGVALVTASYLEDAEVHLPAPSIRVAVSNLLTCRDIRDAGEKVARACREVFGQEEEK